MLNPALRRRLPALMRLSLRGRTNRDRAGVPAADRPSHALPDHRAIVASRHQKAHSPPVQPLRHRKWLRTIVPHWQINPPRGRTSGLQMEIIRRSPLTYFRSPGAKRPSAHRLNLRSIHLLARSVHRINPRRPVRKLRLRLHHPPVPPEGLTLRCPRRNFPVVCVLW